MTPPLGEEDGVFEVPPEHVSTGQLYMLLQQISTKQSLLVQENVRISRRLETLEKDTSDMVAAWKAGGAVLRLVRWAALVGGAVIAVWKFFKGGGG